jgi:hypothetical protein
MLKILKTSTLNNFDDLDEGNKLIARSVRSLNIDSEELGNITFCVTQTRHQIMTGLALTFLFPHRDSKP